MSQNSYSFLPWLRQGLANRIQTADNDAAVKVRAEVLVQLALAGEKVDGSGRRTETVERKVGLYGPGDLTGIERRAIVRVEPRDWITDYEPNYLPHIEFYDEDFPWRYTPTAPDLAAGRLRPWIALVVLDEDEFDDTGQAGRPLPFIEVDDLDRFPPAAQLWAWAHVHVNRSLAASDAELVSTDMPAVLGRFDAVLAENPDLAYSRLVSARKLAESRPYHAFLVPVFESGRLAGLGIDPAGAPHATFSAWEGYGTRAANQGSRFPYYHRWFFRTGTTGDFESLVRLLQPRFVDKRVGTRDIDVRAPGSGLPGIDDPDLGGVLKLGGALRVPRRNFTDDELKVVEAFENWFEPYPHDFQRALATFVNLGDDYEETTAEAANAAAAELGPEVTDNHDPLITPPLYGRWPALTRRLLAARNGNPVDPLRNWVHELNLDPRHRVAAGFGTRVVQQEQERYMDAAWGQIGRVLEANRRIRLAQLGKRVSASWHERYIVPLLAASHEKALAITGPVAGRVLAGDATVRHRLAGSRVAPAMLSAPLRRVLRPGGRLVQATEFTGGVRLDNVLERVNAGEASAAPPKTAPPEVVTADQLAEQALPDGVPPFVVELLRRGLWWVALVVAVGLVIVVLLLAGIVAAAIVAAALIALALALRPLIARWTQAIDASDAIGEAGRTPEAIDALPSNPDFVVTDPQPGARPVRGGADSAEAARFKRGLRDNYAMLAASAGAGAIPVPERLALPALAADVVTAIDPAATIPRRVRFGIDLPARIAAEVGDDLVEAMAYPEFDTPMYEPLKDISAELLLPNINLIEQNSITLLETNQDFIESYMVGLNHEFARELLWREYPTDQRGSYFRQFWDVRGMYDPAQPAADTLKEKLRDIPPLHTWPRRSLLGQHDNREDRPGAEEEELVLVIRGELLKRYPTAVIYAHRACYQRTGPETDRHPCERSGGIDNTVERRLAPLTQAEEENPPRSKVRTPLYEAKVDPDIYFFGFDLVAEEAIGGTGDPGDEDPGWFFVIKERPGEPRFGLDIDKQPEINVWNDLSWADVQPQAPGAFIEITPATATIPLVAPTGPDAQEKLEQHQDDTHVSWQASMGAADLAYILYQAPVLVAVHAAEMLPRKT
jgi:hypothetical protein